MRAKSPQRLMHTVIDTSHLLLGILREEDCFAAKILKGLGLELAAIRKEIGRLPAAGVVPDASTAKRIAEAAWMPRLTSMPDDQIVAQNATLTSGVWIVTGSHQGKDTNTALAAFIQKEDGKILRLHMEKLDS